MKFDENGVRLCDSEGCEFPAVFTYVWHDDRKYSCPICTNKLAGIADMLGHPIFKHTLRPMTIDEMIPDVEDAE